MKINFELDFDDFYNEDDGTISEAIKSHLLHKISDRIYNDLKKSLDY